jgi:hypothetical protein
MQEVMGMLSVGFNTCLATSCQTHATMLGVFHTVWWLFTMHYWRVSASLTGDKWSGDFKDSHTHRYPKILSQVSMRATELILHLLTGHNMLFTVSHVTRLKYSAGPSGMDHMDRSFSCMHGRPDSQGSTWLSHLQLKVKTAMLKASFKSSVNGSKYLAV